MTGTEMERAGLLLAASLSGDIKTVRELLGHCGNPVEDRVLLGGHAATVTPLMAAAAAGHERVVEALLECGADPSRRDQRGRTAAYYARCSGHNQLAERLDTVVDKEQTLR
jgi:hypothetical protein